MAGIIHPTTTSNIGFGFGSTSGEFYPDRNWHGSFYNNFHGGIDYWGPLGYPIWSCANGTILYAGFAVPFIGQAGGNGVVINHGENIRSVYGHMDTVTAVPGQQVIAGQRIGTMGASGIANGVNHLHFEIRTLTTEWGEDVENPYALMQGGALQISGFAGMTDDIPWIEPMTGTAVTMALCVPQANGDYSLPTDATTVINVYYDRLRAEISDFTLMRIEGALFIRPNVALDIETEVRADYVT